MSASLEVLNRKAEEKLKELKESNPELFTKKIRTPNTYHVKVTRTKDQQIHNEVRGLFRQLGSSPF